MIRLRLICALCALTVVSLTAQAPARPAPPSTGTGTLVIGGDVATSITLEPGDLRRMPRVTVAIKDADRTLSYEGVLVGDLLKRAGAPLGGELRGNAVASYVLASASDGYQAVFSLAELDPAFTANDIIVADTLNGKPLLEAQGPIRLVAPKDLRGARGVRMLERLDLVRLRK